jgi:ferredoxin
MHRIRRRFSPSPSTRAFWREARRTRGYSFFDWLHGYVYARWPYLYIGVGVGEHPLARILGPWVSRIGRLVPKRPGSGAGHRTFADSYHGKVVTPQAARQLVTVQKEVRLTDLEQVIPYGKARDLVLQHPDHIAVLECPCRSARPNPCLPLDVCLIVGEPFVGFVAEHHPRRARQITSAEAIEILEAEHARGHVHHAFFKDAMLGRFYAICNCCTCCCGAMQAMRNGIPMLASSGYVSHVDESLCIGCGICEESCQFGAIVVDEGRAVVEAAACMGCGVCVSHCDLGALALERDDDRGTPLELEPLLAGQ